MRISLGVTVFFLYSLYSFAGQEPGELQNFNIQANNYENIVRLDVVQITFSKKSKGYPFLVEAECYVLKAYKGKAPQKKIRLIEEREDLTGAMKPKLQTYFFFYNDADKIQEGEFLSEFRLWEFSEELERYLMARHKDIGNKNSDWAKD